MKNKNTTLKLVYLFILAILVNFVWEILHSTLYIGEYGLGSWILWRASIMDAIITVVIVLVFLYIRILQSRPWTIFAIGFIWSFLLEIHAITTNRWVYDTMPIIPILSTGLTPTIQIGLIAYVLVKILKIDKIS